MTKKNKIKHGNKEWKDEKESGSGTEEEDEEENEQEKFKRGSKKDMHTFGNKLHTVAFCYSILFRRSLNTKTQEKSTTTTITTNNKEKKKQNGTHIK